MITIIHGEDITASRNYFIAQRQKVTDAISLEGISLQLHDIMQALASDGLFVIEKNIFIEELLSKRKPSKDLEKIRAYLVANQSFASIFLWESKELTQSQLKQWSNGTIKQFKLPHSIFLFLDNIKPKNGKTLITLFHRTLEHEDEQFIFFMLIRHFRLLLVCLGNESSTSIDEAKRLAPWQKSKLQKQAGLFSPDTLQSIYQKLFVIDLAQKTGTLAYPISVSIDFLLSEI